MKKCAVITNGYCSYPSVAKQVEELSDELNELGVAVKIVKTDELIAYVDVDSPRSLIGERDFVVYLDKDPYISHLLEKCGYKLVNSAKSIELCDDKMKTHIALSGVLPMPKTVSFPLAYQTPDEAFCLHAERLLGYPIVVKEVFGSMGKGVYLCRNRDELLLINSRLCGKPHVFQEFIGKGGEDIRVIVLGGSAVAAMKRVNDNDFRSNIAAGGVGKAVILTDTDKELAELAAKTLKLDYCGVDILHGDDKSYVCEVNSNAFWSGISKVTGINIAGLYAKYLYGKFYPRG